MKLRIEALIKIFDAFSISLHFLRIIRFHEKLCHTVVIGGMKPALLSFRLFCKGKPCLLYTSGFTHRLHNSRGAQDRNSPFNPQTGIKSPARKSFAFRYGNNHPDSALIALSGADLLHRRGYHPPGNRIDGGLSLIHIYIFCFPPSIPPLAWVFWNTWKRQ